MQDRTDTFFREQVEAFVHRSEAMKQFYQGAAQFLAADQAARDLYGPQAPPRDEVPFIERLGLWVLNRVSPQPSSAVREEPRNSDDPIIIEASYRVVSITEVGVEQPPEVEVNHEQA